MSLFSQQLPEWDNTGVEPSSAKKTAGWLANEKPPAEWFNWFFNRVYNCISEIRTAVDTFHSSSFIDPTTTQGDIMYRDSSGTTRLPIGDSNQVLSISGGNPVWSSVMLGQQQIYATAGTYTFTATKTGIHKVIITGAGGSGGCDSYNASNGTYTKGSGGGAGGTCIKWLNLTSGVDYSVVVGAGGVRTTISGGGNYSGIGGNGANSTFTAGGTTYVGGGGICGSTTGYNACVSGGSGGTASNGDLNLTGDDGQFTIYGAGGVNLGQKSSSFWGSVYGGGAAANTNANPGIVVIEH
jgi:hypothetical protein